MTSRIFTRPAGLLLVLAAIAIALLGSFDDVSLRFVVGRIMAVAWASAPAFVVLVAATCLGLLLLLRAAAGRLTAIEIVLLAFGVGASILTFGVAASGIVPFGGTASEVSRHSSRTGCGVIILLSIYPLLRACRVARRNAAPLLEESRRTIGEIAVSPVGLAIGGMAALAGCMVFVASYTPPLLYDVTEYHLGALREYVGHNRIIPMPHNWFARFPFPIESVYFLGLQVGWPSDFAPKLINAAFIGACALLIDAWLKRAGCEGRWRMLAILVFVSHKVTLEVSLDAFIDAPTAFFVGAAVFAALLALGRIGDASPMPSLAPAAALLFGTALVCKYTVAQLYLAGYALFLLFPLGVMLIRRRALALFALSALAFALPLGLWLGKNIVFYGNPLEPFFARIFVPDDPGRILRERFYIESHGPQSPFQPGYWSTLATRPAAFGWYLLAPLVAFPLVARRHGNLRLLAIVAIAFPLWNLIRQSEARFLLPAVLLLCVLAGQLISLVPGRIPRRALALLLLIFCAGNLALHFVRMSNGLIWQYFAQFPLRDAQANSTSNPLRAQFLQENLGEIGEMAVQTNSTLPLDARLLLVYEARPYLFERQTVYNTVFDSSEFLRLVRGATSADDVAAKLRAAGITHVLVNRRELRRFIEQYARQEQLERAGITDPVAEFARLTVPEDLYPPFYLDPQWQALRAPVLEFINRTRKNPALMTGKSPIEVYVVRL